MRIKDCMAMQRAVERYYTRMDIKNTMMAKIHPLDQDVNDVWA
jgi:hypothetical protein